MTTNQTWQDMAITLSPIANARTEDDKRHCAEIMTPSYYFNPAVIDSNLVRHINPEDEDHRYVNWTMKVLKKTNSRTGEVTEKATKAPRGIGGGPTSSAPKFKDGRDATKTWGTFSDAVSAFYKDIHKEGDGKRALDGVGIVLRGAGIVCIDLDHCLDVNGIIESDGIRGIFNRFNGRAYIEKSPSGTGLHIFAPVQGIKALEANKYTISDGHTVEMYYSGRFITLTGDIYGAVEPTWEDCTDDFKSMCDDLTGRSGLRDNAFVAPSPKALKKDGSETETSAVKGNGIVIGPFSNDEIKEMAKKAGVKDVGISPFTDSQLKQRICSGKIKGYGEKWKQLFEKGLDSEYVVNERKNPKRNDVSDSAFMMSFAYYFPFYNRFDIEQMRRLFRASALYTGKESTRKFEYCINKAGNGWAGYDNHRNKNPQCKHPFAVWNPNYKPATAESWEDDLVNDSCGGEVADETLAVKNAAESLSEAVGTTAGTKPYTGNYTAFTGQPKCLRCAEWIADDDGIRREVPAGKSSKTEYAAKVPLLPVKKLIDVDTNEQKIELAYRLNGRWYYAILPRAVLANGREIVKALARLGIDGITTNSVKATVQYLDDILSENNEDNYPETPLKICKNVARLGWVKLGKDDGRMVFAPYADEVTVELDSQTIDTEYLKPHGTLDAWVDAAGKIRKMSPVARIILAVSFAAPLIKPLKLQNGLVHIYGPSETGKTALLNLGKSVWGFYDRYCCSMNGTPLALTTWAATMNNMPVFLDELQTTKKKGRYGADYDPLIYNFAQGVSRAQCKKDGGLKASKHWDTLAGTTGEEPILKANAQSGALNRVLEVEHYKYTFREKGPQKLLDTALDNYAQAGPAYIDYLQEHYMDKKGTMDALKPRFDAFEDQFRENTGKQAKIAAVLCLGDELARECFWHDEKEDFVEVIRPFLKSAKDIDIAGRAFDYVTALIASHREDFKAYTERAWGKFALTDDDAHPYDFHKVYFIKPILEERMKEAGYDLKAVQREWANRGWLVKFGRDYATTTSFDGPRARAVLLQIPDDKPDSE